jgi:predicted Zn-dependent protease
MEYKNPHIPENINTSKEHPLKDFSILLIGSIVLLLIGTVTLAFGGGWLASKIPFSAEIKIANMYDLSDDTDDDSAPELTAYLQSLTDKISEAQKLPDGMKVTAHYLDDNTVNAFATIGGHIFMYRGLLEKLPNENTLVTLLSHEIAHVKYRHPIKSLGSGIIVSIGIAALTGGTDSNIMGETGMLTVLKFGRDMEQQSDEAAAQTLYALYGHLNGGAELFEIFHNMREEMGAGESYEMFSTHPLDEDRIENFSTIAKIEGWEEIGELTPLPDFYRSALKSRDRAHQKLSAGTK